MNAKIEDLKSHLKFKKEELDGLISETQKEEEYLLEQSKEFAGKIDERLLASYNRIRTNSINGLAVVGLERGARKDLSLPFLLKNKWKLLREKNHY